MIDMLVSSVRVEDLEVDNAHCVQCHTRFEEAYIGDDEYYCKECIEHVLSEIKTAAERYAVENCKITGSLEIYDSTFEHRCTPDEYEHGLKESYTENAVKCHNRHGKTNYDALVNGIDRNTLEGRLYYVAIRERIDQLIEDESERLSNVEKQESDDD